MQSAALSDDEVREDYSRTLLTEHGESEPELASIPDAALEILKAELR